MRGTSRLGALRLPQLLPGVFPDEQGAAHVDVERAGDALLRDLHAHVQLRDQAGWDSFPLVSGEKGRRKVTFPVITGFFSDVLRVLGKIRMKSVGGSPVVT